MAETPSLHQINNKSLRERVLDSLREAILSGELRPGQALVETDLASQMGVSRAPLREAIQTLNTEGFVSTVPYHGTTVTRLTKVDIEELYSLRGALESFAMQRIFQQGVAAESAVPLRQIYERLVEAASRESWRDLNVIDREFHDKLIELSGHRLLASTWYTVHMRVQQVMSLHNLNNRSITQVAENHRPILETMEKGALDEALEILHLHIASTGDLIAEGWLEDDEETMGDS
ncbi:MAG: GntR family transcriptional regulator [Chloroflexota bacterium]